MLPIGPLAIAVRHTSAGRPVVVALVALAVAGILGGLAMLLR